MIRVLGAVFFIFGTGFYGMNESLKLHTRTESIEKLIYFINRLEERVKLDTDEISEILKSTLPNGIDIQKDGIGFSAELCLKEREKTVLKEFLENIGMTDEESLHKKCLIYTEIFKEIKKEALCEEAEKSRLFSMGGWMAGLALSLLCL